MSVANFRSARWSKQAFGILLSVLHYKCLARLLPAFWD
jgi:hypothetical protein